MIFIRYTYQRVFSLLLEKKKTELIFTDAKTTSSVRDIPMSTTLKNVLLQQKQESVGKYAVSSTNKPMEPRLLTYHFHQICETAGLPGKQWRHHERECFNGHSSTQMTLDTYASSTLEQRILVVDKMERGIS